MKSRHYLLLVGIILLGAVLRFWNLDLKPVWLDEVITALFSLGRNYYEVPLNEAFSLSALERVFTLNAETSCAQIAQTIATQSVHPPLFFCWMHDWLRWTQALPLSWIWKLRALPALLGVVSIAAVYQLNRIAFSPAAGLTGAMVMAVSPFAVYLSQEARHYTLPMLLVILALLGLYQMQTDLYHRQLRPGVWVGWMVVNSVGFYVHYFFLLAFVAQVATLLINILTFKALPTLHRAPDAPQPTARTLYLHPRRAFLAVALAATGIGLTYLPWLPTFLSHISRPETNWMKPFEPDWMDTIAPLYQLPMGWILMAIALPVENQPDWLAALMAVLMVLFSLWLLWQVSGRFAQLWSTPDTHLATRLLAVFLLCVLLEFLAIVYLLGKDITSVPRYNFLYFPAICALLGACLAQPDRGRQKGGVKSRHPSDIVGQSDTSDTIVERQAVRLPRHTLTWAVLLVGVLSSTFVVSNLVFLKPYQPDQVAKNVQPTAEPPLLMGMAYGDLQEVALGLSFALALKEQDRPGTDSRYFAFLPKVRPVETTGTKVDDRLQPPSYAHVWENLARLKQPLQAPFAFWMVAPGLKRNEFPPVLAMQDAAGSAIDCPIDRDRFYRLGIPYQLYRCKQ
ncbi:MAG: glycosyltransferase family 39 protein [Stenomitos frigidus ULC029]